MTVDEVSKNIRAYFAAQGVAEYLGEHTTVPVENDLLDDEPDPPMTAEQVTKAAADVAEFIDARRA